MARRLTEPFRVLLPILRGQAVAPLLSLADTLAAGGGGKVLGLVESAGSRSMGDWGQRRLSFLRWLAAGDYEVARLAPALPLDLLRTRDPARAVLDAVAESRADLVLAEWPGRAAGGRQRVRRLLDALMAETRLNLALVRLAPEATSLPVVVRSVLVPIRGGPNARLAVHIAATLSDVTGAAMTLLHVQNQRDHPDRRRREREAFRTLGESVAGTRHSTLELSSDSPVAALMEIAGGFDVAVMGTRLEAEAPRELLAATMARLVQSLRTTVILARSSGASARSARREFG